MVRLEIPERKEWKQKLRKSLLTYYYEDNDVYSFKQAQGNGGPSRRGNYTGTVVNALLYHCRDLSGINGVLRPV